MIQCISRRALNFLSANKFAHRLQIEQQIIRIAIADNMNRGNKVMKSHNTFSLFINN